MASSTYEQIAQFTGWLQELSPTVLGPGYEVRHRYFGYDLPYRWEIRSEEPRWRWTLALSNKDVIYLCGLSEPMQREFLFSRLRDLVCH